MDDILARFMEEHPNIEVTHDMYDWGSQESQLTTSFAGEAHDVYDVSGEFYAKFAHPDGPLLNLATEEYVLDPDWKEMRNNIIRWEDATSPDGFIGGVPNIWLPMSMFLVNVSLLKEAGVPDDWYKTVEGVTDAAIKVKQKTGNYGIAYKTGGIAQFAQVDWYGHLLRGGGDLLNEDRTGCGMNKPEVVETFQWLVDLVFKYEVAPKFMEYDAEGLQALFVGGKLAIIHHEMYVVKVLQEANVPFEYDYFPIPGLVNNKLLALQEQYSIAKASKHKDAAWELIKFLVKPETAVPYMNIAQVAYPALSDFHGIELYPGETVLLTPLKFADLGQGQLFHPQTAEFISISQPIIDEMMLGKITPQEAVDRSCELINEKLEK